MTLIRAALAALAVLGLRTLMQDGGLVFTVLKVAGGLYLALGDTAEAIFLLSSVLVVIGIIGLLSAITFGLFQGAVYVDFTAQVAMDCDC